MSVFPHPKWADFVMEPPRISSQSISRGWHKGLISMSLMSFQELGPLVVFDIL